MRTPFCCDASRDLYRQYYSNQQSGSGMPVYRGVLSQRGYGIGSFLKSMFMKALPFLQRTAAAALRTGAQVFDDVREGKQVKESLKQRVPETIKDVGVSMLNQSGSGQRKRRSRRRCTVVKRKKHRKDIFS